MSKYKTIQTEFRTLSSLLRALADLGYTASEINIAKDNISNALALYGYLGDERAEKAAIRIDRNVIGSLSNDVGFRWNGTAYEMLVSDYDNGAAQDAGSKRMNAQRQAALKQRYGFHEVSRQARTKGYTVTEKANTDGTIRLELSRYA